MHINKQAVTNISFPFSLNVNAADDSSKAIMSDLLSKCGMTGGEAQQITIDYDVTPTVKFGVIPISFTISNHANFDCPVSVSIIHLRWLFIVLNLGFLSRIRICCHPVLAAWHPLFPMVCHHQLGLSLFCISLASSFCSPPSFFRATTTPCYIYPRVTFLPMSCVTIVDTFSPCIIRSYKEKSKFHPYDIMMLLLSKRREKIDRHLIHKKQTSK